MVYIKNDLIDFDSNMYLTVGSLILINNIITVSNNIEITIKEIKITRYITDDITISFDNFDKENSERLRKKG